MRRRGLAGRPVGIIGRIDPECREYDGQTVKTRTVYKMLVDRYGSKNVKTVDTYDYVHRAPVVVVEFVRCLISCDDVIVSLSRNGRKFFFPLLYAASKLLGKRIYHNLIGGWLAADLEEFPQWMKYLNSFEVNWVESRKLVERLAGKGVSNAVYLPNFKQLDLATEENTSLQYGPPYRLCIFSRVMKEKGVGDAIEVVGALNKSSGFQKYTLDIFGPIDKAYEAEFYKAIEESDSVRYVGCVDPSRSVDTIKNYFALLFPTRWALEGIPGTIIDALCAGLPIISSRWQYYDEMLKDGETGYSFELLDLEGMAKAIEKLAGCTFELNAFRANCLQRAKAYSAEEAFSAITRRIEENRS